MHASVQRPRAALGTPARPRAAAAAPGRRCWTPVARLRPSSTTTTSSSSITSSNKLRSLLQPACRPQRSRAVALLAPRAQLTPDSGPPPPADDASNYLPYSAELLLATTRLGHLERYRQEVAALYQPGMPVELTRCGLLISNIFHCQLDHRLYFDALEQLLAAATLLVMQRLPSASDGSGFAGLDVRDARHVLAATRAINEVLFAGGEQGASLALNEADPYDPLNSSLADVLDTGKGSPWALALAWLHLGEGLGLPCRLVGSTSQLHIRVGDVSTLLAGSPPEPSPAPVFLVSVCQPGVVYAYPIGPHPAAAGGGGGLQHADSLASSADLAATSEWSRSLNDFLRPHREHQQQQREQREEGDDAVDLSAAAASSGSSDSSMSPGSSDTADDADSGLSGARASEFSTPDAQDDASTSAWLELDAYAVQDLATRNSWKALYGPGALAEWGGSVRSLSSLSGGGSFAGSMDADSSSSAASAFAAAAAQAFPDDDGAEADAAAASLRRSASLDTQCGGSVSMELDAISSDAESSTGSSWGHASAADSSHGATLEGLVPLTWADVGWLQPVSKRMLLQQLLADAKVPLMMSGRQEELLLVLRYLRATDPFSLPDLRDMALALARERPEEAAPLLREYLAAAPGAVDADMVGEVLAQAEVRVQLGRARGWQSSP